MDDERVGEGPDSRSFRSLHRPLRMQPVNGGSSILLRDFVSRVSRRRCFNQTLARSRPPGSPSNSFDSSYSQTHRLENSCDGDCPAVQLSVVFCPVSWGQFGRSIGLNSKHIGRTPRRPKDGVVFDFVQKMGPDKVLPEPIQDSLERSTRNKYVALCAAFDTWCNEKGYCSFPSSSEVLSEYLKYRLGAGHAASCLLIRSAVRHLHKDLGLLPPEANPSVIMAARKFPRKVPDVEPFPVRFSLLAFVLSDDHFIKFLAVITALSCRLMLRPGELTKIKLDDLRITQGGVLIRLVARKCDKTIRADPWHFISCAEEDTPYFCLACALRTIATERFALLRGDDISDELISFALLSPLFADVNGRPLPPGILGHVFNTVALIAHPGSHQLFTGKSGRVGGAVSAALGGASEVVIRTTGDWRSETICRYVGGIIACRSGIFSAMVNAS